MNDKELTTLIIYQKMQIRDYKLLIVFVFLDSCFDEHEFRLSLKLNHQLHCNNLHEPATSWLGKHSVSKERDHSKPFSLRSFCLLFKDKRKEKNKPFNRKLRPFL